MTPPRLRQSRRRARFRAVHGVSPEVAANRHTRERASRSRQPWTDWEEGCLRSVPVLGLDAVAGIIGRSRFAIQHRLKRQRTPA